MSMFTVFDIAASGMNAQNVRLNTIASNLANANSANGNEAAVYRAKQPVFQTYLLNSENALNEKQYGVQIVDIVDSEQPLKLRYEPQHPLANEEGYVYYPNVNVVEEMANMISTSRTFESNVQVADSTKNLMLQTLRLGN